MKVVVFRAALDQGGADRAAIQLLNELDPDRFERVLLVARAADRAGMAGLDSSIRVHNLGAASLRKSFSAMRRFLAAERPDLLLSLDSAGNIVAALARALGSRRTRLILSERNILWNGGRTPRRAVEVVLKALTYRMADHVTAVSEGVRDDLHRLARVPLRRISVMRSPVVPDDIEALAADSAPGLAAIAGAPLVAACGRLIPQKDHATLIRAFARVVARHPDAQLAIIGEGECRESLAALAKDLDVEDRLHLPGFLSNPFPYIARADVFVLSSRNEGMPGVLLQAMALARPVVATDCHSGPAELIEPGVNGALVPIADDEAMADAIAAYLGDQQFARSCGEKAVDAARPYRAKESVTALITQLGLA